MDRKEENMKHFWLTTGLLMTVMTGLASGQEGGRNRNPNENRDAQRRER
jgi:hypothetical protein